MHASRSQSQRKWSGKCYSILQSILTSNGLECVSNGVEPNRS